MKKHILLGTALLAVVYAFPQNTRVKVKPTGYVNTMQERANYLKMDDAQVSQNFSRKAGPETNPNPSTVINEKSSAVGTSITWNLLTGSMNTYGMLVSQSRPLQYNDNVNAVSFLHRKSTTYTTTSNSNSGTIVAEISSNWGTSWDSTCIYANFEAGRYPQGAIYGGPGNTNIANAYIVGSGPTVSNNTFTGDWYASKKLAAAGSTLYNTTPDPAPNAQQFLSLSSATYATNQMQHGWSRYGFSSTDDGVVRSLALIEDDLQGLSTMRGVMVVKGTYNAGVFTWTTDSLIPNCVLASDGTKQLSSEVQMAWNESGTIGYVVMIGALNNATLSNRGFQPIIYKTTNSGGSWAQVTGIDFNSPAMASIVNSLFSVSTNTSLSIPIVNDYDMTVDGNGKLHIGAILASTFSSADDSIGFTSQVAPSINPTENYKWLHTAGSRPYLIDFIGDGTTPMTKVMVDSLWTEGPSASPTGAGFNDNPWDPTGTGGAKIGMDSRVQVGRTPDGQHITFSWVESDTNFTSSGRKWNNLPNIKARLMKIGSGATAYQVSDNEINVTQYPVSVGPTNPEVSTRASLTYMSPTTGTATASGCVIDVKTPFTITNSNPYSQLTNNTTWYTTANLSYSFCSVGINELVQYPLDNSMIYPNPAKNAATLAISMKDNSDVYVSIYSINGQQVKSDKFQSQMGLNQFNLDLNDLNKGIYLVKIQSGNSSSSKKLIVE